MENDLALRIVYEMAELVMLQDPGTEAAVIRYKRNREALNTVRDFIEGPPPPVLSNLQTLEEVLRKSLHHDKAEVDAVYKARITLEHVQEALEEYQLCGIIVDGVHELMACVKEALE